MWIWILINTTPTLQGLAVHFGYWISQIGDDNKRKHTQSMPIFLLWCTTYPLTYHMVLEWRPAIPLGMIASPGGSQKPAVSPFAKMLLQSCMLQPIPGYSLVMTQHWNRRTQNRSWKWSERRRKENFSQWQWSMTFWRCRRAAKTYLLQRINLTLKTNRWLP